SPRSSARCPFFTFSKFFSTNHIGFLTFPLPSLVLRITDPVSDVVEVLAPIDPADPGLHLPDRHALSCPGAVVLEERARPARSLNQDRAWPLLCGMQSPTVEVEVMSLDRDDVLRRVRHHIIRGAIRGR